MRPLLLLLLLPVLAFGQAVEPAWTDPTSFTFAEVQYVDPVGGNDANDGLTELTPVKTIKQARDNIQIADEGALPGDPIPGTNPQQFAGEADTHACIKIKAGTTVNENFPGQVNPVGASNHYGLRIWYMSGLSSTEPFVITRYGVGANPVIEIRDTGDGFILPGAATPPDQPIEHLVLQHVSIKKVQTTQWEGTGIGLNCQARNGGRYLKNCRFEDVYIEGFGGGVSHQPQQSGASAPIYRSQDVHFLGCRLHANTRLNSGPGPHVVGFFWVDGDGLTLEKCVIDFSGMVSTIGGVDVIRPDATNAPSNNQILSQGVSIRLTPDVRVMDTVVTRSTNYAMQLRFTSTVQRCVFFDAAHGLVTATSLGVIPAEAGGSTVTVEDNIVCGIQQLGTQIGSGIAYQFGNITSGTITGNICANVDSSVVEPAGYHFEFEQAPAGGQGLPPGPVFFPQYPIVQPIGVNNTTFSGNLSYLHGPLLITTLGSAIPPGVGSGDVDFGDNFFHVGNAAQVFRTFGWLETHHSKWTNRWLRNRWSVDARYFYLANGVTQDRDYAGWDAFAKESGGVLLDTTVSNPSDTVSLTDINDLLDNEVGNWGPLDPCELHSRLSESFTVTN